MPSRITRAERALIDAAIAAGRVTVCPAACHALWPTGEEDKRNRRVGEWWHAQITANLKMRRRAAALRAAEAREVAQPPKMTPEEQRAEALRRAQAAMAEASDRARARYEHACNGQRTLAEVAELLGVSHSTASQQVRRYGLKHRIRPNPVDGQSAAATAAAKERRNAADMARYAPLLDGTRTVAEIAAALGIGTNGVRKFLRKRGLMDRVTA